MEFFGLTSYGFSSPIKDMMRPDYKQPEKPQNLLEIKESDTNKSFSEMVTELDCYIGYADGYSYKSADRLKRMRRKYVFSPDDKVHVPTENINRCHRIGKFQRNDKPRPVLLCLKSYEQKCDIIRQRKSLKGSAVFVKEDLTKMRVDLLKKAVEKYGMKNTWSLDGKIYAFINNRPCDIYRYAGTDSMNIGWWTSDEALKNETWYKPPRSYPCPTSETTRFINHCLKIEKYFRM